MILRMQKKLYHKKTKYILKLKKLIMKTLLKFKAIAIILLCSLTFFSCSKNETVTTENTNQEEFLSTTENSISELESIKDAVELESEVIFSKEYDEDLTEEEASAKFDKDLKEFLLTNPQTPKKALSTEWFYNAGIRTGYQTGNTTKGLVQSRVYFRTNRGTSWVGYNYPYGTASKPGWKFQHSRGWYPNNAPVSYVKPIGHRISMKGTDAWFVIELIADVFSFHQSIAAWGNCGLTSKPYVWLDSYSSSGWDHYYTSSGQWGNTMRF